MNKILLIIIASLWASLSFAQTLTTPWTSTPPIGPGGNVMLGPFNVNGGGSGPPPVTRFILVNTGSILLVNTGSKFLIN